MLLNSQPWHSLSSDAAFGEYDFTMKVFLVANLKTLVQQYLISKVSTALKTFYYDPWPEELAYNGFTHSDT